MTKKVIFLIIVTGCVLFLLHTIPSRMEKTFNAITGIEGRYRQELRKQIKKNSTSKSVLILGNSGIKSGISTNKAYKFLTPAGSSSRELYYALKSFQKKHSLKQFRCAILQVQLFYNEQYFKKWIYYYLSSNWYSFFSVKTLYQEHFFLFQNLPFFLWALNFLKAKLYLSEWRHILYQFHSKQKVGYTMSYLRNWHKQEFIFLNTPYQTDLVFLKYYKKIKMLLKDNNISVTLLVIPIPNTVSSDIYQNSIDQYLKKVQNVFSKSNIIDIRKKSNWSKDLFFGFLHLNAKGKKVLSKIVQNNPFCKI